MHVRLETGPNTVAGARGMPVSEIFGPPAKKWVSKAIDDLGYRPTHPLAYTEAFPNQ